MPIGQLLVRELILVFHGLLQPEQLRLPRRGERKLPIYPIGSTSALLVNLEACNACGVSNWDYPLETKSLGEAPDM
jgi:hypothetical protein